MNSLIISCPIGTTGRKEDNMKSCWSCKHCINDYFATGTLDCKKFDDMTEEEIDNYYTNNGGDNCIYYEEEIGGLKHEKII